MIKNFALLGNPVEQSLSPAIHQHFLRTTGMNGGYIALTTNPLELQNNVTALIQLGFVGANITIPHKEAALKLAHKYSPEAEIIGASNTLIFEEGHIRAENTDWWGFTHSLPANILDKCHGHATIIGCGGSARAVCYALSKLNFERVSIVYREQSKDRAKRLCSDFTDQTIFNAIDAQRFETSTTLNGLLVNTTPIGMKHSTQGAETLPVSLDSLCRYSYIYDLIYHPMKTDLLLQANKHNIANQNGSSMLLAQAAKSFELWTGYSASILLEQMFYFEEVPGRGLVIKTVLDGK